MFLGTVSAPSSKDAYYRHLLAFHSWLQRTGRRDEDPMRGLTRPRVPRIEPHPATRSEITALLSSGIRRRTRAMVVLGASCGLRAGEIAAMRGEDVDLGGARLRVVGKGGHAATLPLNADVLAVAEGMPRQGWWFPAPGGDGERHVSRNSVSQTISAGFARLGLDRTCHDLRRYFGTELVRSGVDMRTVQLLMRHANLNTTQRYAAVADESRGEAVATLPSLLSDCL
nr:site-specific integrase [Ornithinimicrobium cryptoxanthini]